MPMFALLLLTACAASQPQAISGPKPRLVTLSIIDAVDEQHASKPQESIAVGTRRNEEIMDGLFNLIGAEADMEIVPFKIVATTGPNSPMTCTKVIERVKSLPVQPGDAVMVYYAGHGFTIGMDKPFEAATYLRHIAPAGYEKGTITDFPFLGCGIEAKDIPNVDMIGAMLASKQPRLTIVMADACNSVAFGDGPAPESFFTAGDRLILPRPRLRSLFREAFGTVLISGSVRHHYSYYFTDARRPTGGALTLRFAELLAKDLPLSRPTNWAEIGRKLGKQEVTRPNGLKDTQTFQLRVGAPFATAVPGQLASTFPDAALEFAQAVRGEGGRIGPRSLQKADSFRRGGSSSSTSRVPSAEGEDARTYLLPRETNQQVGGGMPITPLPPPPVPIVPRRWEIPGATNSTNGQSSR